MATQYPNSGKLSHNRHKEQGDKRPDLWGEIIMTRTALKGLLEEHNEDDITIKLSAWQMSGQNGPWIRLSWNNYKKPEGQTPYTPQPFNKPAAPPAPPPPADDEDLDLPF